MVIGMYKSYIRKEMCCPASTTNTPPPPPSCSGDPLWILKYDGLECSGQRIISINSKSKRMIFREF